MTRFITRVTAVGMLAIMAMSPVAFAGTVSSVRSNKSFLPQSGYEYVFLDTQGSQVIQKMVQILVSGHPDFHTGGMPESALWLPNLKGGRWVKVANEIAPLPATGENAALWKYQSNQMLVSAPADYQYPTIDLKFPTRNKKTWKQPLPGTGGEAQTHTVLGTTLTIRTPAGTFNNVVETRITDNMEPHFDEYLYLAPGVGTIEDKSVDGKSRDVLTLVARYPLPTTSIGWAKFTVSHYESDFINAVNHREYMWVSADIDPSSSFATEQQNFITKMKRLGITEKLLSYHVDSVKPSANQVYLLKTSEKVQVHYPSDKTVTLHNSWIYTISKPSSLFSGITGIQAAKS